MTKASVSTFFFDSGINLSSKKCVLFRIRVKYIRHVVSACDIDPDHDMIWKVREWLTLSFFFNFFSVLPHTTQNGFTSYKVKLVLIIIKFSPYVKKLQGIKRFGNCT